MQSVARPCHICHEKIVFAGNATGCPGCDIAWHQACRPSGRCPLCGNDRKSADVVERKAAYHLPLRPAPFENRIMHWLMDVPWRLLKCALAIAGVTLVLWPIHTLTQSAGVEFFGSLVIAAVPFVYFGLPLLEQGPSSRRHPVLFYGYAITLLHLLIFPGMWAGRALEWHMKPFILGIAFSTVINAACAVLLLLLLRLINHCRNR